jgi:hypothetical protein
MRLQSYISDPSTNLTNFAPLPLPLHPEIMVTGIIPGKSKSRKVFFEI